MANELQGKRIAIVATDGFEQSELLKPLEALKQAGAQADVIEPLSFGLGLLRIAEGGTVTFEQKRVNEEVWLPSHILIHGDARLAYLKKVRAEIELTYRDYKKFQTDSKIVTTEEK